MRTVAALIDPVAAPEPPLPPVAATDAEDAFATWPRWAVSYGVGVSLYLNRRWTHPIARLRRAESGRDWMLNSGILRLDHERAGPATHAASAAIFATYPLWVWLGWDHAR